MDKEHIKEIESKHFNNCNRKGATIIKVITLQKYNEAIDFINSMKLSSDFERWKKRNKIIIKK